MDNGNTVPGNAQTVRQLYGYNGCEMFNLLNRCKINTFQHTVNGSLKKEVQSIESWLNVKILQPNMREIFVSQPV
jgi:hypothetical protein